MKSRDWAEIVLGCFTAVYAVFAATWLLEALFLGVLSGVPMLFQEFRLSMTIGTLNFLLRPTLAFVLIAYLRRRAVLCLQLDEEEQAKCSSRIGVEMMIAALIGYGAWQIPLAVYRLLRVLGKMCYGYEEIPEKAAEQWTIPANQHELIGSVVSFYFALILLFWAKPIALWVLPKIRPTELTAESESNGASQPF